MAIRQSRAADIADLVRQLASDHPAAQDSAAARLVIIGSRAGAALEALVATSDAPDATRARALRTLAAVDARRAWPLAQAMARAGEDQLSAEAVALLQERARGGGAGATRAFETLTALALDTSATVPQRLAAVAALEEHPPRLVRPVFAALASDTAAPVVARIARRQAGVVQSFEAFLEAPTFRDPDIVGVMVAEHGATTRLAVLKRTVDVMREQEAQDPARAEAWRDVRGRLHQAIAERGSRMALYDVRETFERSAGPLPVGFATAAALVGDATCLAGLASTWLATTAPGDRWWRDHVAHAFEAVVLREGITRGHAALRRLLTRQPATASLVALAPRRVSRRARPD